MQSGSREIRVEQMELRIQRDRATQIILGLFVVAKTLVYHARVEQQQRVFRFEVERFPQSRGGLLRLRILVKRPG